MTRPRRILIRHLLSRQTVCRTKYFGGFSARACARPVPLIHRRQKLFLLIFKSRNGTF